MRLISLLLLTFTIGCASTTIIRRPVTGDVRDVRMRHNIGLWGLVELSDPVDPEAVCRPLEWVKLNSRFNVTGILLGVVTLGIYTPAAVTVTCAPPQSTK